MLFNEPVIFGNPPSPVAPASAADVHQGALSKKLGKLNVLLKYLDFWAKK